MERPPFRPVLSQSHGSIALAVRGSPSIITDRNVIMIASVVSQKITPDALTHTRKHHRNYYYGNTNI